jgi:hypothetical protein
MKTDVTLGRGAVDVEQKSYNLLSSAAGGLKTENSYGFGMITTQLYVRNFGESSGMFAEFRQMVFIERSNHLYTHIESKIYRNRIADLLVL